jgi:hypothetical protein
MSRTSHPPWLDHYNFIWRSLQITKLFIMQFSPWSQGQTLWTPLLCIFFLSPLILCLCDLRTCQTPSVCALAWKWEIWTSRSVPNKGKAMPVTVRGGSFGCETPKLPHYLDNRLTDFFNPILFTTCISTFSKLCVTYALTCRRELSSAPV